MKRNKIGNTTIDTTLSYLCLDTPVWKMRQSEVVVLSYLDVLQEQATFTKIDSELQRIYNEMDKYYCVAKIIENLGTSQSYLVNAFYIFNEALEAGEFDRKYKDILERNNAINTLIVNIINDSINYTLTNENALINSNLWAWWQTNVLEKNYYIDPKSGERQDNKPDAYPVSISGDSYDYVAQFKKSAICFTYSAVSADNVQVSKVAALKRKKQIEARRALNICNVQLDSEVQANYIASGIMQSTGGMTAAQFINKLKRKPKVGELTAAAASVIAAAISALVTLVGAVIAVRQNKLNSEARSTLETSGQYAPAESDFLNIDLDGDGQSDLKKILLVGAIGLAVYYYL